MILTSSVHFRFECCERKARRKMRNIAVKNDKGKEIFYETKLLREEKLKFIQKYVSLKKSFS